MLTRAQRKKLKQDIKSNQHEIVVISVDDMDKIIRNHPKAQNDSIQTSWTALRGKLEVGASYYANADDIVTMTKLISDLGSFSAQAYIKNYNGKAHIILKGHPGLRTILSGTRYGVTNPKVVTMGLGRAGAVNAAKSGGIISIVLISAFRILDYVLSDHMTLNQLVGALATDVVKVGIATGASIAAVAAVGAMGVTLAVGPILAVVIAGIGISIALNAIDNKYGITDRVIAGLDEMTEDGKAFAEKVKKQAESKAYQAFASIVDYIVDSAKLAAIDTAKHTLQRFLDTRPRVLY